MLYTVRPVAWSRRSMLMAMKRPKEQTVQTWM